MKNSKLFIIMFLCMFIFNSCFALLFNDAHVSTKFILAGIAGAAIGSLVTVLLYKFMKR